ncbi:MAG TPA: amidase [Stellaceae bacterium]|nr:amidase [Stellaceae bacterium]
MLQDPPRHKSSAFVPHDLPTPLRGAAGGPLSGLTAAVKDMFDIAGERTGAGNPTWLSTRSPATTTASAVARLLAAGADIIGKTVCDEFFFSIAGVNIHYGTPVNARAPGRLPGGSSSGSAAAVGAGACDLALGSDTGGSVRVPAALNGIYGIRTSHGRVSVGGAMAMAPSFDTVGWFAAGPGLLRKLGPVMLEGSGDPTPLRRLLLATDAFTEADEAVQTVLWSFVGRASAVLPGLEEVVVAPEGFEPWRASFRTIQGREIWAIYGDWIERNKPKLGPGIAERMAYAATLTAADEAPARAIAERARHHLRRLVPAGTVLVLPTVPSIAPKLTASAEALDAFRSRTMALTSIAGLGGLPQVNLPAAQVDGYPVGLSLMGAAGTDEMLLDLAVALGPYCGG